MFILQLQESQDFARRVYLHLVDSSDGVTAKTGQTGKAWISKNGGTPQQTLKSLVEVSSTNTPGLYYVELSVNEVSSPGWIQIRYKAASILEFQEIGQIVAYDPYNKILGTEQSPMAFAGGPDIDYKKITKLMEAAANKAIAGIKFPKIPEFPKPIPADKIDLSGVEKWGRMILAAVQGIKPAKQQDFDYKTILGPIAELKTAISALEVPKTDMAPVLAALDEFKTMLGQTTLEHINPQVEQLFERIKTFFDSDIEKINGTVKGVMDKLDAMPYLILNQAPKPPAAPAMSPVEEANNVSQS